MSNMPTAITSLPFELLSRILKEATYFNTREIPVFSYGLSGASEVGKDARLEPTLSGHTVPDASKWRATVSLRQVNRQWHDWASLYALRDLYITRWRGSERYFLRQSWPVMLVHLTDIAFSRWMQSRSLDTLRGKPSTISVYRDPYHSLKQTLHLFRASPGLGTCVHRLWFNGYYSPETVAMIFEILRYCPNLDHLTVPWTTLRYGTKEDWSQLLGRKLERRRPLSLEFLSVDLSANKIADTRNQFDELPLESAKVDFGRLERLKVFGNTNFMPIIDRDLIAIARTARNLKEVHITETSTTSINAAMALVDASRDHLQLLEHFPLTDDGFQHPDPASTEIHRHLCEDLLQYPQLRDLSISLPSLCEDLLKDPSVPWRGEVQIRAASICNHPKNKNEAQDRFWRILDLTRALMAAKDYDGVELDIELFINHWVFEPRHGLVHGNIEIGQALSDGSWPLSHTVSSKGPYGQTGLYGKDERPYSCISEKEFAEGLRDGYVSF